MTDSTAHTPPDGQNAEHLSAIDARLGSVRSFLPSDGVLVARCSFVNEPGFQEWVSRCFSQPLRVAEPECALETASDKTAPTAARQWAVPEPTGIRSVEPLARRPACPPLISGRGGASAAGRRWRGSNSGCPNSMSRQSRKGKRDD